MSDRTLYRQAWELNEDTPNAVYTVDDVGVYYEGYLVKVEPSPKMHMMEDSWGMTVVGYDQGWFGQFDEDQAFVVVPIDGKPEADNE